MNYEIDQELILIAEKSRAELGPDFFAYRDYVEECAAAQRWPDLQTRADKGVSHDVRLGTAAMQELYALFCTNDARYKEVRQKAGAFSKVALPAVAGYVAAAVGGPIGLASGAVALLAMAVFKLSVGVFCRMTKSSQPLPAAK